VFISWFTGHDHEGGLSADAQVDKVMVDGAGHQEDRYRSILGTGFPIGYDQDRCSATHCIGGLTADLVEPGLHPGLAC